MIRAPHRVAALAACATLWIGPSIDVARAQPAPASSPSTAPSSAAPLVAPLRVRDIGVAVIALDGASETAWPLAQAVYGRPSLRPVGLDEPRARVLVGEPLPEGASTALRDLAETRGAIHGDDAPSRQLLASIAATLHAKAIVVVSPAASPGPSSARVFLADGAVFDAASYVPDVSPSPDAAATWTGAVASLERAYGTAPASAPAPLAEVKPRDDKKPASSGKSFFSSPWFWGAIGAAAFGGAAVFLATRDNEPNTIHLQMQVPK